MKKILAFLLIAALTVGMFTTVTFATAVDLEKGKTNLVSGDSSDFEGGTVGEWTANYGGKVVNVSNPAGGGKVLKFDMGEKTYSWWAPTLDIKPIVSKLESACTLYIAVDVYSGKGYTSAVRLRDLAGKGTNGRWHDSNDTNDTMIGTADFVTKDWSTVIITLEITAEDIQAAKNHGAWFVCFDKISENTTEFYLDNFIVSDGVIKEKVEEPVVRVKLTDGKENLVPADGSDFENGKSGIWNAAYGGNVSVVKNPAGGGKVLRYSGGESPKTWWTPTYNLKTIVKGLKDACTLYVAMDIYTQTGFNTAVRLRDRAKDSARWHDSNSTNDKQIASVTLDGYEWTTVIVKIDITKEDIAAAQSGGEWFCCIDNISNYADEIYIDNFFVSDAPIVIPQEEKGPVEFAGAFGNNMVLQRDTAINVWGNSEFIGETVTVTFKGTSASAAVGTDGKWSVILPQQSADIKENELTVTCKDVSKTLTGILVGDVFLIGGQSNAEKSLSACGKEYSKEYIESLISRDNGMIRLFAQGCADGKANPDRMATPQDEPIPGKKWKKEHYSTALSFSAMGIFFAHKIVNETNVPVGLVMVCSAGSPVSQLMSKEASQAVNYTRYENGIPVSGMFNALMNPFINMKVKGMLYYQGESEASLAISDYGKYNVYLNAYVEDLRTKMNQNFPFYYVQLSSHDGQGLTSWPGVAEQRAVQFDGTKVIQNSAMIVCMDYGFRVTDQDYAHPNYKEPVGNRLADLVLAKQYGIGDENYVTSPYPEYAYKTADGIVVRYHNFGDGLKTVGTYSDVKGFKAITGTRKYVSVEAEIINENEILLKTNGISGVIGVGYGLELLAFNTYDGDVKYIANVANSNDLPAPTFKFTTLLNAPLNMGDVDGDGKVGSADRILLSRYLAAWKDSSILTYKSVADINGDGKVNSIDRILLSRHLAGWENTDKYFN